MACFWFQSQVKPNVYDVVHLFKSWQLQESCKENVRLAAGWPRCLVQEEVEPVPQTAGAGLPVRFDSWRLIDGKCLGINVYAGRTGVFRVTAQTFALGH